jgi:cytoskeletal protein RodZ
MAGISGRWLVTASLVGMLGGPWTALAQAERPWVDPPSEEETRTQAPVSTPPSPPATPPQAAIPNSATPPIPSPTESAASAASPPIVAASPRKTAADRQAKRNAATVRKVRARSQQANSSGRSQNQDGQVARRRISRTQVSQAESRRAFERRARVTRYGSMREGLDAGLQVMRLRTIQLPDGRRIDVLTRPDQDIASGLPDGY